MCKSRKCKVISRTQFFFPNLFPHVLNSKCTKFEAFPTNYFDIQRAQSRAVLFLATWYLLITLNFNNRIIQYLLYQAENFLLHFLFKHIFAILYKSFQIVLYFGGSLPISCIWCNLMRLPNKFLFFWGGRGDYVG